MPVPREATPLPGHRVSLSLHPLQEGFRGFHLSRPHRNVPICTHQDRVGYLRKMRSRPGTQVPPTGVPGPGHQRQASRPHLLPLPTRTSPMRSLTAATSTPPCLPLAPDLAPSPEAADRGLTLQTFRPGPPPESPLGPRGSFPDLTGLPRCLPCTPTPAPQASLATPAASILIPPRQPPAPAPATPHAAALHPQAAPQPCEYSLTEALAAEPGEPCTSMGHPTGLPVCAPPPHPKSTRGTL